MVIFDPREQLLRQRMPSWFDDIPCQDSRPICFANSQIRAQIELRFDFEELVEGTIEDLIQFLLQDSLNFRSKTTVTHQEST